MPSKVPPSPDAIRNRRKTENQVNQVQFPSDLGDVGMLLMFKKYSYGEKDSGSISETRADIQDSLFLSLPDALIDAQGVRVSATELGLAGNAAAAATSALGSGGLSALVDAIKGVGVKNMLGMAASAVVKDAASAIAPGIMQGIEAGAGAKRNPFQALLFDGVDLRTFTFNWTFVPKSRSESNSVAEIIRLFKYHSLPYYKDFKAGDVSVGGKAFLSYPSVCLPLIKGVDALVLKPCMINRVDVDYGGGGELAFLEGGNPAAFKLSVTMQEMQMWTREDYGGSSETVSNNTLSRQAASVEGDTQ
jgi:hypothetical protein